MAQISGSLHAAESNRPIVIIDVVGDGKVGKSTLIEQWHKSHFRKEMLKVAVIQDSTLASCLESAKVIRKTCGENTAILVVGNKCDLDDEDLSIDFDLDLWDEINPLYLYTAGAKEGINVDLPFLHLITHMLGHEWLCKTMVDACRHGNLALVKIICSFLDEQVFPSGDYLVSAFLGHVEQREKFRQRTENSGSLQEKVQLDSLQSGHAQVLLFLLRNCCPLSALSSCCEKDSVLFGRLLLEMYPMRPGGFLRWTSLGLPNLLWMWVPSGGDKLSKVDISRNSLEALPVELFQLHTIQELHAKYNRLRSVPPPTQWQCDQLRLLNLAHNCLTAADGNGMPIVLRGNRRSSISGRKTLPKLFEVNLSHNQLTALPPWVCDLAGLGVLNISSNPINRLPKELGRCRDLLTLYADIERIVYPRRALVRSGAPAIVRYLSKELRNAVPYSHLGLRLLGNSGVGKGELLVLLSSLPGSPEHGCSSVQEGTFELRARSKSQEAKVTFHALNFVDEEIFRITHQCFLIQRAVYLAVWNAESGRKGLLTLRLWLNSVRACAPSSPVILVGTFLKSALPANTDNLDALIEEMYPFSSSQNALDERGLPTIVGRVYVAPNAPAGQENGLAELRSLLYQKACEIPDPESRGKEPLIQQQVPCLYLKLQEAIIKRVVKLRRKGQPGILSLDEFQQLTQSCSSDTLDEDEMLQACQFLHECGMLLYFRKSHNGLDKVVFIDLQWLYEAVARVITAPKRVQGLHLENGILRSDLLSTVFQGRGISVPEKWHVAILGVLERFHVAVALDRERSNYLIPALLPFTKAKSMGDRDLSKVVARQYLLAYLPTGFWSHLISQLFVFLAKDVSKGSPSRKAEVRLDEFARSICISLGRPDGSTPADTPGSLSPARKVSGGQDNDVADWLSTARLSDDFCIRRPLGTLHQNPADLLPSFDTPITAYRPEYLESVRRMQNSNCVCTSASPGSSGSATLSLRRCSSSSSGATLASLLASFLKDDSDEEISVEFSSWQCGVQLRLVLDKSESFSESEMLKRELAFLQIEQLPGEVSGVQLAAWGGKRIRAWLLAQVVHLVDSVLYNWYPSLDKLPCKVRRLLPCPHCLLERSSLTESDSFLPSQGKFFTLEECVQAAENNASLSCEDHGKLSVSQLAPDIVLADLPKRLLLDGRSLELDTSPKFQLGSGGFASVYRAKYNKRDVAVKLFRTNELSGVHPQQELRAEVNMLQRLQRHPGVVGLIGACLSPLSLVLELAPLGSLKDLLRDTFEFGLPTFVAHHLLHQVAMAMSYLHSQNIIHCDLKPHNILLWPSEQCEWEGFFQAKLADYGVSHFALPAGGRHAQGTKIYMGPEMLEARGRGHATYTAKADMFSFGVVVFEVITGRHPYWQQLATMRDYELAVRRGHCPRMVDALAENQAVLSRRRMQNSESSFRFFEGYYHDQVLPSSFDLQTTPPFNRVIDSGIASPRSPRSPLSSPWAQSSSLYQGGPRHPSSSFRRSHLLAQNAELIGKSSVQSSPASPKMQECDVKLTLCQCWCFETLVVACLQLNPEARPTATAAAAHLSLCCCSSLSVQLPFTDGEQSEGNLCLAASLLSVISAISESPHKRLITWSVDGRNCSSPASPVFAAGFSSLRPQPHPRKELGSPLLSLSCQKDLTPSPRLQLLWQQRNIRTPTRPASLTIGRQLSVNPSLPPSATSPFSPFSPGPTPTTAQDLKFTQYVVCAHSGSREVIIYDCSKETCTVKRPSIDEGDRITALDCVNNELWLGTEYGHVHVFQLPHLGNDDRESVWSLPAGIASVAAVCNKLVPSLYPFAGKCSFGVLLGLGNGQLACLQETSQVPGKWLPVIKAISDNCVRLVTTSNTSAEACACCGKGEVVFVDILTLNELGRWDVGSSSCVQEMVLIDSGLWLCCEGSDKITQWNVVDGTRHREICTRCLDVDLLAITNPSPVYGSVMRLCASDLYLWVLLSSGLLLLIRMSTGQLLCVRQAHIGAADMLLLDRHSILTIGRPLDNDSDPPGSAVILQWQAEDYRGISLANTMG